MNINDRIALQIGRAAIAVARLEQQLADAQEELRALTETPKQEEEDK